MKRQIVTKAIVLSRIDYGEADRILTVLTPDYGKVRLMARGVRRIKSKLAGGIELFSVSTVMYMPGRGEIGTLISARLDTNYGNIVRDINRTMLGYELIKQLNKITEDASESAYFNLLQMTLASLDVSEISSELINLWFMMQLLREGGHTPNLYTDIAGSKLDPDTTYEFDYEAMAFMAREGAKFTANHIKFLRLGFSPNAPVVLQHIQDVAELSQDLEPLVRTIFRSRL